MKKLLSVSLVVALAACQRGESPRPDSALSADLALASQMQAARPVPQFQDTTPQAASTPEPTRSPAPRRPASRIDNAPRVRTVPRQSTQPVPTLPQPEPTRQAQSVASQQAAGPSIGAGATFSLASGQRICTSSNRPGDRFVATVSNTVSGSNGGMIPAGSNVVLEVASVTDNGITFSVNSVELNGRNYPVQGDVASTAGFERVRLNGSSDAKKVAGGAAVGALIGQLMKKNTKGTVIGAAAGAAAGAVAAKATEKYDNCLPVGAPMRLTLSNALFM